MSKNLKIFLHSLPGTKIIHRPSSNGEDIFKGPLFLKLPFLFSQSPFHSRPWPPPQKPTPFGLKNCQLQNIVAYQGSGVSSKPTIRRSRPDKITLQPQGVSWTQTELLSNLFMVTSFGWFLYPKFLNKYKNTETGWAWHATIYWIIYRQP